VGGALREFNGRFHISDFGLRLVSIKKTASCLKPVQLLMTLAAARGTLLQKKNSAPFHVSYAVL
jgi:hypothetical protein